MDILRISKILQLNWSLIQNDFSEQGGDRSYKLRRNCSCADCFVIISDMVVVSTVGRYILVVDSLLFLNSCNYY